MAEVQRPLEGVKVVEMATFIAAPAVGRILADLGAEVVKIESAKGDNLRFTAPNEGRPLDPHEDVNFDLENAGKKGVVVDLRTEKGTEVLFKLLEGADVFITNWRPQALERKNLTYEDLKSRFPKLVYASLTEGGVTYNANSSTTRGVVNIISDYVVSYGVPVVSLSYTPDPIGHEGGSSVPSLSVSQGVTYASGATGTLSSGYTALYSGSAAGFSLNASTGIVSALSNEGAETVSYGTPVVSLSYNASPIACTGGSATPTVTYSQTKTTTRSPSSPRTLGVTVTVSMNGQSATASGSVTQSGPGTTAPPRARRSRRAGRSPSAAAPQGSVSTGRRVW